MSGPSSCLSASPLPRPSNVPRVFLIRHGQSTFNRLHALWTEYEANRTPSVRLSDTRLTLSTAELVEPDAPLTDLGLQQASRLRHDLRMWNSSSSSASFRVDVIVVSPLMRALQTMLHALADYHQQYTTGDPQEDTTNTKTKRQRQQQDTTRQTRPVPIVVHPLIREMAYCMSDLGRPLSELRQLFAGFRFDESCMLKYNAEAWWFGAEDINAHVWSVLKDKYRDQNFHSLEMNHVIERESKYIEPSPHPHTKDEDRRDDEIMLNIIPHLFKSEPFDALYDRLREFLQYLTEFGNDKTIVVVAHSQVFFSLGQGSWFENCEMREMDWSAIPSHILSKASV